MAPPPPSTMRPLTSISALFIGNFSSKSYRNQVRIYNSNNSSDDDSSDDDSSDDDEVFTTMSPSTYTLIYVIVGVCVVALGYGIWRCCFKKDTKKKVAEDTSEDEEEIPEKKPKKEEEEEEEDEEEQEDEEEDEKKVKKEHKKLKKFKMFSKKRSKALSAYSRPKKIVSRTYSSVLPSFPSTRKSKKSSLLKATEMKSKSKTSELNNSKTGPFSHSSGAVKSIRSTASLMTPAFYMLTMNSMMKTTSKAKSKKNSYKVPSTLSMPLPKVPSKAPSTPLPRSPSTKPQASSPKASPTPSSTPRPIPSPRSPSRQPKLSNTAGFKSEESDSEKIKKK